MDKHKPHYELEDIKRIFSTAESIRMTMTSEYSMNRLNMTKSDVLNVIQTLTKSNFYKSMTSHSNYRIWQDVYHARYRDIGLYVKFTIDEQGFLIISYKER